jgi:LPS-assembly protein
MHAWLVAALLVWFQQDVPLIEADQVEFMGSISRASGNVVATWRDIRVETERVEYDQATGRVFADGGVNFIRGEERLAGSRLEMQTGTRAGIIYDVTGYIGPGLWVEAAEARRLEDGRYEVLDAVLVLCEDDGTRVLETTVSRAVIDPEQSLRAFTTVLRLRGVPIFYSPYVRTSLAGETRASGLLTPQTSTSTTKGRSISQAYYLVINRSADMTLRAEYFSRRGMGGGVQFRAVPSPGSRIEVNNFFARDRLGQGGQRTQIAAFAGDDRFRTVADLNIFSSFEFRQVFEEDFNVISSPTERSVAFGTYNSAGVTYNASYHRQGTFFRDQQTAIVRKFPSIDALVGTRPLGNTGAYFALEASVAALHRRDAVIDSPQAVGRFDLYPRLEIPVLRGSVIDWSHSVGIRETLYTHRSAALGGGFLNRLVFDYGFRLTGPSFERVFDGWTHVVEPEIAYRYVSGVDDFDQTLRVDEYDLLADTHEVRYGIANRFFTDREILSWSLTQKYYFDPRFGRALVAGRDNVFDPLLDITGFGYADRARRFSPIVSLLRFAPDGASAADLEVDYDTTLRGVRSAGFIGRYRAGVTSYNLAYFRTRESPIQIGSNQVRATLGYGSTERIGINGSVGFSYNVDESILQATTARVSYNTECYGLHLEFSQFDVGSRKESRFRFAFSLRDLGSIGTLRQSDQIF